MKMIEWVRPDGFLRRRWTKQLASAALLLGMMPGDAKAGDFTMSPDPQPKILYTNGVELDNPVVHGTARLSAEQMSQRTEANGFFFNDFSITTEMFPEADDLTLRAPGGFYLHGAWPRSPGQVDAGSTLDWEIHGVTLGRKDNEVQCRYSGYRRSNGSSWTSEAEGTWKLATYSYLVPVQVVVVLPDDNDPTITGTMQQITQESQLALWDDRWSGQITGISHPGGSNPATQGLWDVLTLPTRTNEGAFLGVAAPGPMGGMVRPDDVWVQCGTQFRLIDYLQIRAPRKYTELLDNGIGICSEKDRVDILRDIVTHARTTPHTDLLGNSVDGIRPHSLTVVYTYNGFDATNRGHVCDGEADRNGVGDQGARAVLFGVNSAMGLNRDLALSHLIGHAMGLQHAGAGYCSGGSSDSLMCAGADHVSPSLFGCDKWWYENSLSPLTPRNCNPGSMAPPVNAECTAMRWNAWNQSRWAWAELSGQDGCGDTDGDGDEDDDHDGATDENCVERFLFVPYCWHGGQQKFGDVVSSWMDFYYEKMQLNSCHDGPSRKFWHDWMTVEAIGCPLADPGAELSKEDGKALVDAVKAKGVDLKRFDALIFATDARANVGCKAGVSFGGGLIMARADDANGQYGLFAHEYGHVLGLSDEYVGYKNFSPNLLQSALGCDARGDCCSGWHECLTPNKLCLGNYAVQVPGWTWGRPDFPVYTDARCIMSNLSAPGWNSGNVTTGKGSHRGYCEACLRHLSGAAKKCSDIYGEDPRRLEVRISLLERGYVFLDEYDISEGRVGNTQWNETGDLAVEIRDSSGGVIQRISPRDDFGEPKPKATGHYLWFRKAVGRDFSAPFRLVGFLGGSEVSRVTAGGSPAVAVASDVQVECSGQTGTPVTLDGSSSYDPDGDTLYYAWSAPTTALSGADSATASGAFQLGTEAVTLKVTDGTRQGSSVTVKVSVTDTTPPVISGPARQSFRSCAPSVGLMLAQPQASDTCSPVTITATIIAAHGVSLAQPIALSGGHMYVGPGLYTVEWRATDSSGNFAVLQQEVDVQSAIQAESSVMLGDRSRITSQSALATVSNRGNDQVYVGVEAAVGDIVSVGPVDVRDRAWVDGGIRSQSSVTRSDKAMVAGAIEQGQSVRLPAPPAVSAAATPNRGSVDLQPGQQAQLAPGSYTQVSVKSRAELVLGPGVYYFDSLHVEPDATLFLQQMGGPVTIYVASELIHRGTISGGEFLLGFLGQQLYVEAPLSAKLIAPSAEVVLRATFTGELFSKRIAVDADQTVTCSLTGL